MTHRDWTLPVIKTLRCQTRLLHTTQPHQDARLEEDGANGASVHSLPQVYASVLPVTCVEYDSLMVKRVYNSGATVKPTITTYMHIDCVNGGLGHDHELLPKQAGDQDAVDAVARQRETNTRTAADTEVLLPFAHHPDQASTVAPPGDERDLFGREEALRMDGFDNVPWDSIKDLRGTTYVQPPTRFRFALQQAQHAILRAIIHNNPSSLASESAWKAFVLSSWLLLGRPACTLSGGTIGAFLI